MKKNTDITLEKNVREIVQIILNADLSTFKTADITPQKLPQWDSLVHLNLITSLEQTFEVEFELDDITTMMEGLPSILKIFEKYPGFRKAIL